MALFLLELPDPKGSGTAQVDGVLAMIIEADSAGEARELASAQFGGDADWAQATATTVAAGVASDFEGFKYRVKIGGAVQGDLDAVVAEYTAVASDTVDLIGAALVIALNASPLIAGAAYVSPTLTAAAIADALGDRTLVLEVTAPDAPGLLPQLVGAIVDGGIAAAVLTVVLEIPTAIPALLRRL